ncbi:ureidoglycolate lyase [Gammaproteobacteria bacterium]|nr:ureidoglycolate lyase [Gammaproteobacteria bacterium]
MITLTPLPLTRERFAPYGDVIEAAAGRSAPMNTARFERFDDLCRVETDAGGRVAISIARCRLTTALPYRFDTVERHPHGSQAFVPLNGSRFVVVVAPPSESVEANDLAAFVTNGRQGVNYHRGTWHLPLIGFETGQAFLVVDRAGDTANCDEHSFDEPVLLAAV